MRFLSTHISCLCRLLLLLLPALVVVSACDKDSAAGAEGEPEYNTYLQITLHTGSMVPATRGPQGGENGDGNLTAIERECAVYNATILLYKDANGINGNDGTPISYSFYAPTLTKVGTGSSAYYQTDVLHSFVPIAPATYHVLVIVNAGDLSDVLTGKTLGEVRDYTALAPYRQTDADDPTTAGRFVMTSANDATLAVTGAGGMDNIKQVDVRVERMAARIDFSPGVSYKTSGYYGGEYLDKDHTPIQVGGNPVPCYDYAVVSEATGVVNGDHFYLTHVQPLNLWQGGTYLTKRVCDINWISAENILKAHLNYLGDEGKNSLNEATDYVISPDFLTRTTTHYTAGTKQAVKPSSELGTETGLIDGTDTKLKYYILTYARENTFPALSNPASFATGLQIDGYYKKDETDVYSKKSYVYYIRHADPNNSNSNSLAMKYGIVRNNVYRVSIERVTSLGVIMIEAQDWITVELPDIQM